ncbi:MAG: 4'-phosphopantetheinyl transferase superfamily protein [Leptolyngbyaceae bacterium]|nr:4'-phosphopantetheinyl transferase superfamily protein [Leptolyngbyaceae bacterium]
MHPAEHSPPSTFKSQDNCPLMPRRVDWPMPVHFPALRDTDVHLWRASLSDDALQREDYESIVSSDERQRAARLKFEHLQHRFIIGRGILRKLLGHYLAIAPDRLQFTYGRYGKPALDTTQHPIRLSFNVSHSHTMALFAFCRQGAIGVDIEHIGRSPDVLALSQRFFTPREHQFIRSSPSEQAVLNFFRLWTCKEAYLKATGEGLSGLQTVEVDCPFNPTDDTIRFLQCSTTARDAGSYAWEAAQCWPDTEYVGAIALGSIETGTVAIKRMGKPSPQRLSSVPTLDTLQTFTYPPTGDIRLNQ